MISISTLAKCTIPALIFIFLFCPSVFAQDDPNLDNTFGMIRPPVPPELLLSDVLTSEEGFDNFFLGINFAEPHISANKEDDSSEIETNISLLKYY